MIRNDFMAASAENDLNHVYQGTCQLYISLNYNRLQPSCFYAQSGNCGIIYGEGGIFSVQPSTNPDPEAFWHPLPNNSVENKSL